mmetsp:Transcript_31063/g.68966  ORF Transcript_31063/g.68966 Transcript_31063/m.68966 type:complete len:225 (+) Transcript_31063:187-861(+)
MLRQLLQHPEMANATFSRAIVLLESNLGFSELEQMLSAAGGQRDKITPEAAERLLRNLVLDSWLRSGCEAYEDALKFTSLVDFFLPYFPLQRRQVEALMEMQVSDWAAELWHQKHTAMQWDSRVITFLVDKVDFDGEYPLEGAKQVASVATRYIARLVRKCPEATPPFRASKHQSPGAGSSASAAGGNHVDDVRGGPGSDLPGVSVMRLTVGGQGLLAEGQRPA